MIRTIFSRTDIFFTICNFHNIFNIPHTDNMQMYKESSHNIRKCVKKEIVTFALATILLILFLEEYYNNINFFTKRNQSKNPQKLLTNNHTVSLHRQHPKKTRHHLQLPKTPKHLHEFLSRITHIPLKNDTLAYLNH